MWDETIAHKVFRILDNMRAHENGEKERHRIRYVMPSSMSRGAFLKYMERSELGKVGSNEWDARIIAVPNALEKYSGKKENC